MTYSGSDVLSEEVSDRWLGAWRGRPELREAAAKEVSSLGWMYISRLVAEHHPDELLDLLAHLGQNDLAYLKALRFLTSPEAEQLIRAGHSLLRRLPQSTRQAKVVAREVRGRIDWGATHRERLSRGGDPTVFLITYADRHTDVPENRALAYALRQMAAAGRSLRHHRELASIGLEAERLLSNAALAGISVSTSLTGMDRQALRMSRITEFREKVAAVIKLHDGLFATDLVALRDALGDRIWLPPEADKLFELWVMFMIVRSLEQNGWHFVTLSLIGLNRGGAPTFVLRHGSREIRVTYQAVSRPFVQNSRYKKILDAYDIDGSARRPDILITAPSPKGDLHLLIEVKLTRDRTYIVESIYKLLGYLADFEDTLAKSPQPCGVLVVWGGVSNPEGSDEHSVRIETAESVRGGKLVPLIEALADAASSPPEPH